MNLTDIKVNTGSWRYSEEVPIPPWESLAKANLWTSSTTRLTSIRRSLASPLMVYASMALETSCHRFSEVGPMQESSYLAYATPDNVPQQVSTLHYCGVLWQAESGSPRPLQVVDLLDNGVPGLMWSTSALRLQTEVGSLRISHPDLLFHGVHMFVRTANPPADYPYANIVRNICLVGTRAVFQKKVCTTTPPKRLT